MIDPRSFAGRTFVFRVNGEPLDESGTFAGDLAFLMEHAVRPIVVAPSSQSARDYVRVLNRRANLAVGLSGADAALLPAGGAGVGRVQSGILATLTSAGYIPVIEPTAFGLAGDDVALPADDVASAIAAATEAPRAIFFHPAGAVFDPETLAPILDLTASEAFALADRDEFDEELRVAMRAAARGVREGVAAAQIMDGRIAHAAIVEFLTAQHLGTQVTGGVFTGSSK